MNSYVKKSLLNPFDPNKESCHGMHDKLTILDARARFAAAITLLDRLLHDHKQPLNLIRVVAQDIKLDVIKDRFEINSLPKSMNEIEQAVDRMVAHIDNLRVFAKPRSPDSSKENVDPGKICRTVIERICRSYPQIEISEVIEPNLTAIVIDPFHIEQALWELVDNAVHAAENSAQPQSSIEISVAQRNCEIVIAVRDNGGGVPEMIRDRLFEPFVTARQKAAGLGLSLALALVNQAGGNIKLAESTDEGSVFEILLPKET